MSLYNLPSYIIWDWNGTLLDDRWLCVDIMNGVLSRRGLPTIDHAQHQELFEFPVIEYYRKLGFDLERGSFAVLGDEFMRTYELRKFECSLAEGIQDVLPALRERGVGQSLLSAYHHDYLTEILRHFGLDQGFDRILGAEDHYAEGKVEQGHRLLDALGVNPDAVVMIGDTLHDFEVADSLGVRCRLLTTGNHSRSKLEVTGSPVFDSAVAAVADLLL